MFDAKSLAGPLLCNHDRIDTSLSLEDLHARHIKGNSMIVVGAVIVAKVPTSRVFR